MVVVVLLKGRDRYPKNFRFNFEASLSELEKILLLPYLIYFLDLLWRIPGAWEERGQKNKQFYRVYRSLRK